MSDPLGLDEIRLTQIDEHPPTSSVRLHGPPGTGKTTESAGRVGRLLRDYDYGIGDVAWATYRKSLATDTLERFVSWGLLDEEQLDEPAKGPTRYLGTMHALGNRTMSEDFAPAGRSDHVDFCDRRDLRYTSPHPWQKGVGERLFDAFAWLKTNRLDPGDPGDMARWPGYSDLMDGWQGDPCAVWHDWVDYKTSRDLIDFYEMLERPLLDGRIPDRPIVVVDEYHDATPLMAELAEMWIDAADIAIVAGDPHQVVNAFDGADPSFFGRLDLPKVLLNHTYRVPEEAWRLACALLAQAHDVPPVSRESRGLINEYRSPRFDYDHGASGDGWTIPDPDTAASPVWLTNQYDDDWLFLARTQLQAAGVCRALDEAGIIYGTQGELEGWHADSAHYLLHNALQRIAPVSPGDFDHRGHGLSKYSDADVDPDRIELPNDEARCLLGHVNARFLAESRGAIEEVRAELRAESRTPTLTEFDRYVTDEFWATHTAGAASVDRLNKGELSDTKRTALKRALKRYESPVTPEARRVEVMTIHASKGKGASNVALYDGVPPKVRDEAKRSVRAEQNEYRTWYVALTRASKRVHVLRDAWEWTSPILPDDLASVVNSSAHVSGGRAHS